MTKSKTKKKYKKDHFYCNDILVNKFVNLLSNHGKKSNGYKLLLKSLDISKYKMLSNDPTSFTESLRIHSSLPLDTKFFLRVKAREKNTQSDKNVNKISIPALQRGNHSQALFHQAVGQVKPSVETRKVRVGGTVHQVPSIVNNLRQEGMAMRWLIASASSKKDSSRLNFSNCLSQELLHSLKKEGQSRQKRNQIHLLAANNRAYIRYRWW